ncbi:uncharacterized protein LOC129752366 [Uranotaenia lowii]|uniref:uncharacterized protein LOC129752366 n=1 Tax=Uranotaenia lowii TaxID=190385 RepID=UPI0024787950|nr:uncharacterized protein LOC129752366 [Uranotaenia lowii]
MSAALSIDILGTIGSIGVQKRLVIHRIGQCVDQKDLPVFMPDFQVTQYNKTQTLVSGDVYFHEDFPNGWKASVTVKNCDDFRPSATCRPFLDNIADSDICTLLAASDTIYGSYLSYVRPKARCPLLKGNYTVRNQPVEDDTTRFLPGSGITYWDARIVGMVGERMVSCFVLQVIARPKKVRSQ